MLEFDFDKQHIVHNLDVTSKLFPGDIIKLRVVIDGDECDCLAQITEVANEIFKFKLEKGDIPVVQNHRFDIIFMHNTGVYKIVVRGEDIIERGEELILAVKNIGENYKIQKRRYFRLNIYKRTKFTKIVKFESDQKIREETGVIENISAAGVSLVTDIKLVKHDHLNLDLSFVELSFSSMIGQVTWVEKRSHSTGDRNYYKAGLEFVWEDLSQQDELANWLKQQTHKYL